MNLRKATAGGQILAIISGDSHVLYDDVIDATGGTYVEVVSGSLAAGVLYY